MAVYSKHNGYTASALLFNGTAPPTNGTLAHDAHAMDTGIKIHLAIGDLTNKQIMAAVSSGNRQYPSRHRDWKKPMVPPSRMTLTVRMMAPMDKRVKTSCKKEKRRELRKESIVVIKIIFTCYSYFR